MKVSLKSSLKLVTLMGLVGVVLAFGMQQVHGYPVIRKIQPFPGSRLFAPNDSAKHTAVVMLHGSEGGSEPYIDVEANILATQGFTVLVYCYFDCNRGFVGPRQTLKAVEATGVLDAVKWLRAQPSSDGKVVVYGFSRGAELAMIIGSLAGVSPDKPNGLIAHAPSDKYVGPYNLSWFDPGCWLCTAGIGKCDDKSPNSAFTWNPSCGPDDTGISASSDSAWLESGVVVPAGRRIEIEKYDGPVLLTAGEKDEVWPVDQTKRIEATLKTAKRAVEAHYFPTEGHVFVGFAEARRRDLVLEFLKRLP